MKRYYQGLSLIMFLMVATAIVVSSYGSHDWFGNSITGADVADSSYSSVEDVLFAGGYIQVKNEYTSGGSLEYTLNRLPTDGRYKVVGTEITRGVFWDSTEDLDEQVFDDLWDAMDSTTNEGVGSIDQISVGLYEPYNEIKTVTYSGTSSMTDDTGARFLDTVGSEFSDAETTIPTAEIVDKLEDTTLVEDSTITSTGATATYDHVADTVTIMFDGEEYVLTKSSEGTYTSTIEGVVASFTLEEGVDSGTLSLGGDGTSVPITYLTVSKSMPTSEEKRSSANKLSTPPEVTDEADGFPMVFENGKKTVTITFNSAVKSYTADTHQGETITFNYDEATGLYKSETEYFDPEGLAIVRIDTNFVTVIQDGKTKPPGTSGTTAHFNDDKQIVYTTEIEVGESTDKKTVKISNGIIEEEVGDNTKSGNVVVYDNDGDPIAFYNIVKDEDGTVYLGSKDSAGYIYINLNTEEKCNTNKKCEPYTGHLPLEEIKEQLEDSAAYRKRTATIEASTEEDLWTDYVEQQQVTQASLEKAARDLGLYNGDGSPNTEPLKQEQAAVNEYLDNKYEYVEGTDITYRADTGSYYGTYNNIEFRYNSNGDLGVMDQATGDYIYKESKIGGARYYSCANPDACGDGSTERNTGDHKDNWKTVNKGMRDVTKDVADAYGEDITFTYTVYDDKGNAIAVTSSMSLREASYLQKQFEDLEQKLKSLLTGYLNKFIDNALGSWSRGVPAGICAHIFGLEYYAQDGWNRVPANTQAAELQSALIGNSNTIIVEGEKEEITEIQYRYAYSLRLIANETIEWQTYLFNSCTGVTSVEEFYDYGALSPGSYYSFHYAGYADEDMIFNCDQEECIFDQACVQITNSEPVCVSLVHGPGFETPHAGSDYDCAVTGVEE